MALTRVEVQSDDTSGGPTSTLKWDTLRAVHGGISVDYSPIPQCGRSVERCTGDGCADDELDDLGLLSALSSPPYSESDSKTTAAPASRDAVSLHHSDPFTVFPVTPQKPRRVYDSDTSATPSVSSGGTPTLWPSADSPASTPSLNDAQLLPYPENERDIEMTPGDLCSIRTPDLHRVAPTMARDRVQQNLNQSAHLPAYLRRVVSPSAKYDGLQSSPAKFEVVDEDEDDVDSD